MKQVISVQMPPEADNKSEPEPVAITFVDGRYYTLPEAAFATERGRVLVVDDEPSIRQYLVCALQVEGYGVAEAENGVHALALLGAGQFDLALIDICLPGMPGHQLVSHVRHLSPDTRIILMSGMIETVTELNLPIDGSLSKPFAYEDFRKTVAAVLSNHTPQRFSPHAA